MSAKKQVKKCWGKIRSSFSFSVAFRGFIYVLPLALFFSYYPLISFGNSESMHFELSLSLIWLVLFDVLLLVMMIKKGVLFKGFKKWWTWILFPVWALLSVIWSLNVVRGVLTAGILWLIVFAVYGMWSFRELFDSGFWKRFLKWFLGSTLVICGWCFLQCILDLVGVSKDYSLMCQGCTYINFGFPHPNGFAVEPQFMGNLLLAPAIVAGWLYIITMKKKSDSQILSCKFLLFCFFVVAMTLFLTFSRGAIYAFVLAMILLSILIIMREKKVRKVVAKRVGIVWGVLVIAFLCILNLQGIFAEVGPTNDTYQSGVVKVLNHLTLGVVDLRDKGSGVVSNEGEKESTEGESELVENSVEKSVENNTDNDKNIDETAGVVDIVNRSERDNKDGVAIFDGYVAESTDVRVKLTNAALEIWSGDFRTAIFGVGLGGAGQALYDNGFASTPREIVQNEYASLLLEIGIIGISLFVLTLVLVIRRCLQNPETMPMMLALILAYGISLLFFSGLPNALQIYLMTAVIFIFGMNYNTKRKKLVS